MRPEILFPLFAPSSSLKGVGPKLAPVLERLAGPLVRDVLFLRPHSLVYRTRVSTAEARDGEVQTLVVAIDKHFPPGRRGLPWRIRTFDEAGFLFLVWFRGGGEHLARRHPPGSRRAVSGKVEQRYRGELSMPHPDYFLPAEQVDEIPGFEAIYPTSGDLPARTVRKLAL
ncbi:MAG TPA: ATP-dependent DNA helicase RecG, partial [Caulobacteraceae bacterium]|nr:ATP-dependent DNA helicase RecG [Caulobacteraceae bacterium]